jgi:hypothetical protein
MSIEMEASKEYYILSIDINKILGLNKENRNIDASTYLDNCLSTYKKLFENSIVLEKSIKDKLTILDCDMLPPGSLLDSTQLPCKETAGMRNLDYFINIRSDKNDSEISKNSDSENDTNENDTNENDVKIETQQKRCWIFF